MCSHEGNSRTLHTDQHYISQHKQEKKNPYELVSELINEVQDQEKKNALILLTEEYRTVSVIRDNYPAIYNVAEEGRLADEEDIDIDDEDGSQYDDEVIEVAKVNAGLVQKKRASRKSHRGYAEQKASS